MAIFSFLKTLHRIVRFHQTLITLHTNIKNNIALFLWYNFLAKFFNILNVFQKLIFPVFLAGNDQHFSIANRLHLSASGIGELRFEFRHVDPNGRFGHQPHLRAQDLRQNAQPARPQHSARAVAKKSKTCR